jgi:hypothetical protein
MENKMKNKLYIIILLSLFINVSCNKDNNSNSKPEKKEYDERPLIEFRQKIKDQLLPQYSDERPFSNVVSKKELVELIINQYFGKQYNYTHSCVEEMPELKTARLGDIVLVEDMRPKLNNDEPYFYFVNIVYPDNTVAVSGMTGAMDNIADGRLGAHSFKGEKTIPSNHMTGEDAIKYLKNNFNIEKNSKLQVKAVILSGMFYNWKWAVKVDSEVKIKSATSQVYNSKIFLISPKAYLFNEGKKKNLLNKNNIEYFKKKVKISIIENDIFNNQEVNGLKAITRSTPKEERIKIIPIEYMIK